MIRRRERPGPLAGLCRRTLEGNWREGERDGVRYGYTAPSTSRLSVAVVLSIGRHHDYVEAERALDGDGLVWIIQPDESGLDALPTGGPLVCGVATNVLHNLSRLALGRPSLTPTMIERLYDERRGLFLQLVRRRGATATRPPSPAVTWAALAPLALPDLPEAIGRRLVEEHLLNPDEFWLPVPPPSVAANDRRFSRRDRFLFLRRHWRGPTWINAAWLLWLGLVRLGYAEPAAELARRVINAVLGAGLREYHDPYTGEGMGARVLVVRARVGAHRSR